LPDAGANDMLSIVVSTIAFFATTYYFKRYLEELGIPKGLTRGTLIFTMAMLVSYVVAVLVSHFVP